MATQRKVVFVNNNFYHIYNRGIERKPIFTSKWEFQRALNTLRYYRFNNLTLRLSKFLAKTTQEQYDILNSLNKADNKRVEIIAFCLMHNHFHFLLKQQVDEGISKFISNFTNSYTKYFNTKHQRIGPILQGTFQAVLVETDEQLIHLSRYIHLNPVSSSIIKPEELEDYYWSSFREYLNLTSDRICNKEVVVEFFSDIKKYAEFVKDQISLAKELDKIKHLTIEEEVPS